jgi:hypothetical protein
MYLFLEKPFGARADVKQGVQEVADPPQLCDYHDSYLDSPCDD